jgi:hypothetical protein
MIPIKSEIHKHCDILLYIFTFVNKNYFENDVYFEK